jgi:hypothetical protein
MIENKLSFMRSAGRVIDVDVARDEPSHIHIARPSRLPHRDTSTSSVEPTDEDLAAADVTAQAA